MFRARFQAGNQTSGEDGFAFVMFAVCMPVLLGIAALLVDVGHGYTDKRKLQNAADAAALAASVYLPSTNGTVLAQAQSAAIDYAARNGATITTADVTFTSTSVENDTVHVTTHSTVQFAFARALGISSGAVQARSVAELGTTVGGLGVMPWGMPEPTGGFQYGTEYCLKLASHGTCSAGTGTQSDFQIVNVDNSGNSSADYYSGLIITGSQTVVYVGEMKDIITGDKVGKTAQGLGCSGSGGRLNENTQTFADVVHSDGGNLFTVLDPDSPRLVLIPVIDQFSTQVEIKGFAVFFIDSCGKNNSVVGRFIVTVSPSGVWGRYQPGNDYGTHSIRLVN